MTNFEIGLLLLSPILWIIFSCRIWLILGKNLMTIKYIYIIGLFIVMAIWGFYFILIK